MDVRSKKEQYLWIKSVDLWPAERKEVAFIWIYAITLNNVPSQMSNKQQALATASLMGGE